MRDCQPTLIPTWLRKVPADVPISLDAIRRLQRGLPPDAYDDPDDYPELVYEDPRDFQDA